MALTGSRSLAMQGSDRRVRFSCFRALRRGKIASVEAKPATTFDAGDEPVHVSLSRSDESKKWIASSVTSNESRRSPVLLSVALNVTARSRGLSKCTADESASSFPYSFGHGVCVSVPLTHFRFYYSCTVVAADFRWNDQWRRRRWRKPCSTPSRYRIPQHVINHYCYYY